MKIFLVICLVAASLAAAEDVLRGILRSPKETLKLYGEFKSQKHLKFLASEDRMRFRLFQANAQLVVQANEEGGSAVFGLNFFSAMTEDEKHRYLGLNVTGHEENPVHVTSSLFSAPAKKLWTNEGKVTPVKDQGSCGSCWAFGAVGGLETRYHLESGKLRNFAEQEYLDCVFEGKSFSLENTLWDGCDGGWSDICYDYSAKNGGRLASAADYSYTAVDGRCKSSSKRDAMVAAKIVGYTKVSPTEEDNIKALASGSLSAAIQVTAYFYQYSSGIIQDKTCTGRVNHAVTAVGYTPDFVLVKNSWGTRWGDNGFVKLVRGYSSNCGLFKYSTYPNLDSTGQSDYTPSDKATDYKPTEYDDVIPQPDPNCFDKMDCKPDYCTRGGAWDEIAEVYCRKICNKCCANGTIRCPDGLCRHEHMC